MNLDTAMRLTEIVMGFAFVQQSIEHSFSFAKERLIFIPRIVLAVLLIVGIQSAWVVVLLLLLSMIVLSHFQGPYNGGADRMSLLVLCCLCMAHFAPTVYWREVAFGYLAVQLVLSYFISGWVKVVNPDWRNGRALCDVFQFSVYPVSESLRQWSSSPRLLFVMSWAVILFELVFPVSIISMVSLGVALSIAAVFHFANACLFGLNRFFWIWISAYPAIVWFQQRIFGLAGN